MERAAVAELIEREFAIAVSLSTVGRYLKAWGLSAQRPVRRAYERNDAAIAAWLKQVYPAIARQAKAEHAAICWGDENLQHAMSIVNLNPLTPSYIRHSPAKWQHPLRLLACRRAITLPVLTG